MGWTSYFDVPSRVQGKVPGVVYGEDRPPTFGLNIPDVNAALKKDSSKANAK